MRPYGENAAYPPSKTSGVPTGHEVRIEIPGDEVLSFRVTSQYEVSVGGERPYARLIGPAEGMVHGVNVSGDAMFEQFVFLD